MIRKLNRLSRPIRVGLAGAGCMGSGIAHQIALTVGMKLEWVASRRAEKARGLAEQVGAVNSGGDVHELLASHPVDVFVEATSSIGSAYSYCVAAIETGSHVVLMNAEVDLVFGPRLCELAAARRLVVTSDAGDQHGVLARMIEEIQLWGFEIVQAGNVKGFLNRHATADELIHEAAKRNLAPRKCCAFTDGTKLNIEMAILANAFGLVPGKLGMHGPEVGEVDDALLAFDLDQQASSGGAVDYVMGPDLGAGVYVIAKCDDPVQQPYLAYYKIGDGPYYLFKRDCHLCHVETTHAIARTFLYQDPILQPWAGRVTDVYAFAKSDLTVGTKVHHGIGGDHFYGMIACRQEALERNWVPIALLDSEGQASELCGSVKMDEALTWDHLASFPSNAVALYQAAINHAPVR